MAQASGGSRGMAVVDGGGGGGIGIDGEIHAPAYPPRAYQLRRFADARSQPASAGAAQGHGAGGGGGGGGGSASAAAAVVVRTHTCPFSHTLTDEGLSALARHIATKHVAVKVEAKHARWLQGKLDACECGRWCRVSGPCDCNSRALRSTIRAGAVVEGKGARRPVQISEAD